jgi:glycosyltransferase involved in cell wall biosynthesis
MRIAQVAPLCESVPPKLYGGTERVVSYLSDELVRQGHHVTLFASGDSRTRATLVPAWPYALRLGDERSDPHTCHMLMIELVAKHAEDFDVIHFHVSQIHEPIARRLATPHVTTLHGRSDLPALVPFYREYPDIPIVSISDAQRGPIPHANWVGTVHHGLPGSLLRFQPEPGSYLAFLGRLSPEKGADRAIAIAKACGMPLRMAAKVDAVDAAYFRRVIEPLLDDPLVEFIGEIAEADKPGFLGHAKALLFPIDWPEPFGLVMIEALACGTPVVAFRGGSVEEILDDGISGFVVGSLDEAVDATRGIDRISRAACRETFERRFTSARMAANYVQLYQRVIERAAPNLVA